MVELNRDQIFVLIDQEFNKFEKRLDEAKAAVNINNDEVKAQLGKSALELVKLAHLLMESE